MARTVRFVSRATLPGSTAGFLLGDVLYARDTRRFYTVRRNAGDTGTEFVLGGTGLDAATLTARGDIFVRDATGVVVRLGLGTNGQVLMSDGSDLVWGAVSSVALASTNPVALAAAAAVGVGTTAARADHVHPTTGLVILDAGSIQKIRVSNSATDVTRVFGVTHESSGVLGTGFGVGLAFYEGASNAATLRGAVDVVREAGGGSGFSFALKASGVPDPVEIASLSSAGRLTTVEAIRPYVGTVAQVTGGVFLVSPTAGCQAFATNGRKPGEGSGAGTGVPAFYDGSGWRSGCDGTALAA